MDLPVTMPDRKQRCLSDWFRAASICIDARFLTVPYGAEVTATAWGGRNEKAHHEGIGSIDNGFSRR
jgi:hypothetical protein